MTILHRASCRKIVRAHDGAQLSEDAVLVLEEHVRAVLEAAAVRGGKRVSAAAMGGAINENK